MHSYRHLSITTHPSLHHSLTIQLSQTTHPYIFPSSTHIFIIFKQPSIIFLIHSNSLICLIHFIHTHILTFPHPLLHSPATSSLTSLHTRSCECSCTMVIRMRRWMPWWRRKRPRQGRSSPCSTTAGTYSPLGAV